MAKFQYFLLVVALVVAGSLLLIPVETEAAVAELGKVKCILTVNFTENMDQAYYECHKKMESELQQKDKVTEKKERTPYPSNATVQDFEWDDHCHKQCVYKTVGILSDDATLPKKTDTTTIFGNDKVSDEHYKKITSTWDDCLVLSEEIGKKKDWDNCKTVTHHNFCFEKKLIEVITTLQVDC